MDAELKQEFEYLNENLKSVVTNQAMIYCRLRDIETELKIKETVVPMGSCEDT